MRGQNSKVELVPARCPSCGAPLSSSDWAEDVAERLCELPYRLDDGWLGQCNTLNCAAAGRRDALRIYLVTEGEREHWSWQNYDTDVVREEAEQVAHVDEDGNIHLHHRRQ